MTYLRCGSASPLALLMPSGPTSGSGPLMALGRDPSTRGCLAGRRALSWRGRLSLVSPRCSLCLLVIPCVCHPHGEARLDCIRDGTGHGTVDGGDVLLLSLFLSLSIPSLVVGVGGGEGVGMGGLGGGVVGGDGCAGGRGEVYGRWGWGGGGGRRAAGGRRQGPVCFGGWVGWGGARGPRILLPPLILAYGGGAGVADVIRKLLCSETASGTQDLAEYLVAFHSLQFFSLSKLLKSVLEPVGASSRCALLPLVLSPVV